MKAIINKVLLSFCGLPLVCMAQTTTYENIRRPIPLSPRAAELTKHVIHPAAPYTGLPVIEFDLFEINAGPIQLPFKLSYHAGGIKVTQVETEVGLGWSILGGPFISRSFSGVPDERIAYGNFFSVPPTFAQLQSRRNETSPSLIAGNFDYLRGISGYTGYDTEPDQFVYQLGSLSGKFFMGRDRTLKSIPFQALGIRRGGIDANGRSAFFITDEDGVKYTFSKYSTSNSNWIASQYMAAPTTTWYVSEVSSPDGVQKVAFDYVSREISQSVPYQEQLLGRKFVSGATTVTTALESTAISTKTETVTHVEQRLKRIAYPGGEIHFDYNASNGLLLRIRVLDSKKELADLFTFQYNDGDPGRDRMKLLGFTQVSHRAVEHTFSHTFSYQTTQLPSLATNARYSQDQWGYFNGKSNTGLIASRTVTGSAIDLTGMTAADLGNTWTVGNADRSASETHMKAGTLQRVTYPSGGYRIYDFEAHRWLSAVSGTVQTSGGLRIKSIKSYDSDNTLLDEFQYRYGTSENGQGTRLFDESMLFKDFRDESMYTFQTKSGTACTGNINAWQRKYFGLGNYSALHQLNCPVMYNSVASYQGIGANNNAKQRVDYDLNNHTATTHPTLINSSNYGLYNHLGLDVKKRQEIAYRFTGGSVYEPVNKVTYQYEAFYTSRDTATAVYETRRFVEPSASFCTGYTLATTHLQQFNFMQYPLVSHTYRPTGETNVTYSADMTDSVVSVRAYGYGFVSPTNVKESVVTGSFGQLLETRYDYPDDVSNITSLAGGELTSSEYAAVTAMKRMNQHRLRIPIQVGVYQNDTRLSLRRTTYKSWGTNMVWPHRILEAKGSGAFEEVLVYTKYDEYGNPVEWHESGNQYSASIWDYGGSHQIAMVNNAQQSDIAYTSFEANGKGNWSWTSGAPIVTDATAPVGNKVYRLEAGGITNSGLSSSKSYTVTYWANSSAATAISGGAATAIRSHNGWTLYGRTVTGVNSITFSGTVRVDDLRLYPSDALMISHAYDRKGNVIAEVAPSDHVTYYTYDGFGRIRHIRTQSGELIASYCYNNAGQLVDCNDDTGTVPTFPPDPLPPVDPPPPPPPPTAYVYSTTLSSGCFPTGPLPVHALFLNPSNNKYYYNSTYTTLAATGYYRISTGTDYLHIVNGVLQSTGVCPLP